MNITLPKNYVSHSQIRAWNSSKTHRQYIERYFYGKKFFTTKEIAFGKDVSEQLEIEDLFAAKPEYLDVLMQLPRIGQAEVELVKQQRGYYTLSFLDRYCYETNTIIEFKTGKVPWTQEKVEKDQQTLFYSWCVERNFGVIPNVELWYMETMDSKTSDFGIEFTGNVFDFKNKFTDFDIELFEVNLENTVREISKAYKQFLNGENLPLIYNWR